MCSPTNAIPVNHMSGMHIKIHCIDVYSPWMEVTPLKMRQLVMLVMVAALGIVLAAGLAATLIPQSSPTGPVYSLVDVRTGLQRHPMAWAGRTILVEAKVQQVSASAPNPGAGPAAIRYDAHLNYTHPPPGVDVLFMLVPPHNSGGRVTLHGPLLMVRPHIARYQVSFWEAFLRRVSVLGRIFPPSNADSWRDAHVFRLTLLHPATSNNHYCGPLGCPDALLLQMS